MPLKYFWPSVCVVAANFTGVADIEAVQFIQPIGDGLK